MDFCSKEGSMNFSQNMIVPNNTTSSSDQLVKQDQSSSTSSSSSSSSAQLKCPRCTSSNTKFCYYNNYNRSQPRHFCKSCKRHWTQGGTLRNVPVGGGRKNKRLKITKTAEATSYSNNNSSNSSSSSSSNSSEEQQPWLRQGGYKDSFFRPDFANYGLEDEENFVVFDPSLLSNLPSFFGNISSSPSSSFTGQFKFPSVSDSSYSTITTATAIDDDPSIKLPETSSMDSLGYWSWDYLDTLISTDLKLPAWDDLQTQELGL